MTKKSGDGFVEVVVNVLYLAKMNSCWRTGSGCVLRQSVVILACRHWWKSPSRSRRYADRRESSDDDGDILVLKSYLLKKINAKNSNARLSSRLNTKF